jgi:hypothetical protein
MLRWRFQKAPRASERRLASRLGCGLRRPALRRLWLEERADRGEQSVRIGGGRFVHRHHDRLLIDDAHCSTASSSGDAKLLHGGAVVVADHHQARVPRDRVDSKSYGEGLEPRELEQPPGLVGNWAEAVGEFGGEFVNLALGRGPRQLRRQLAHPPAHVRHAANDT